MRYIPETVGVKVIAVWAIAAALLSAPTWAYAQGGGATGPDESVVGSWFEAAIRKAATRLDGSDTAALMKHIERQRAFAADHIGTMAAYEAAAEIVAAVRLLARSRDVAALSFLQGIYEHPVYFSESRPLYLVVEREYFLAWNEIARPGLTLAGWRSWYIGLGDCGAACLLETNAAFLWLSRYQARVGWRADTLGLFVDDSARIRLAAIRLIGAISKAPPQVQDLVVHGLLDRNREVRNLVTLRLSTVPHHLDQCVPALVRFLNRGDFTREAFATVNKGLWIRGYLPECRDGRWRAKPLPEEERPAIASWPDTPVPWDELEKAAPPEPPWTAQGGCPLPPKAPSSKTDAP